jgi:hypothetical protein
MSRLQQKISAPARFAAAFVLAAAAAAALGAPTAHAQTAEELAAARQVFTEGKALEGKGQWAEALEKFKKVAAVKMTPQVRFHIALCEENLGKLVSAIRGFDLAAEEAKLAGSSATEVATNAPERAAALRGRVAKLRVDVTGKQIDSKILVDDVPLAAKDQGTDMLMDPGPHVVEVRDKDDKSTFKKELTLAEKASERLEVPIDDKEPAASPTGPDSTPPPPPPSRVPVYVAAGVGAAAFATSAVFFVLRGNTISQAIDAGQCMPDPTGKSDYVCKPGTAGKIEDLSNQGKTNGIVSGIFLGVGIASAATAVGFLVAPLVKKPAKNAPPKAGFMVLPTGNGVQVVGSF